jgi:hypothetical protein
VWIGRVGCEAAGDDDREYRRSSWNRLASPTFGWTRRSVKH